MTRFLIIDGHAYAYRAFYAIKHLRSPEGRPTNAIFGFIKMLTRMREKLAPSHVAVVWDGGLSAERLESLPDYKAQRPEMPDDLSDQLDEIVKYLEAARIPSLCEEGVEADDWIGSLATQAVGAGMKAVIASSDKDFMQLVGPDIGLLNPNDKSETIWGETQVHEKSGVGPEQIVDWLSLIGDSVDNIPGVPGVGPKTAAQLLNQFGSVAGIYAGLEEIKSARLQTALMKSKATVERNQDLIRLSSESPEAFVPEKFAARKADTQALAALFRQWGFRTLLAEAEASINRQEMLLCV